MNVIKEYETIRGLEGPLVIVDNVKNVGFGELVKIRSEKGESFGQVLEERLRNTGLHLSDYIKDKILSIFCMQKDFSKVRNVEKASVKLRFRVMTEVKAEGNILNSNKYPDIKDNTLNFVLPCDNENEDKENIVRIKKVFNEKEFNLLKVFKIKHHFNGKFIVFQVSLQAI